MAADYLAHLAPTGEGRSAAAYHDKRFAILAALEDFDTVIYTDKSEALCDITETLRPPDCDARMRSRRYFRLSLLHEILSIDSQSPQRISPA
jgi:hypothetical protein